MSRIGKTIITVPAGVTLAVENGVLVVRGPKGELREKMHHGIELKVEGNVATFIRTNEAKQTRALHGFTRSVAASMVLGVTEGFEKRLEMVGTGYRAALQGTKLVLSVGYSHPVNIEQPAGITFAVEGNNKIVIKGMSKHDVGQIAANIRKVRPPEPYKGKGIKYDNEVVRRKAGKAVKAAGAAAA